MRLGVWDHMPLRPDDDVARRHRTHIELIVRADELGLSEYWLAEHHFSPTYSCLPAPHLLLAAAAPRTERIRMGSLINVLPLHDPIRLVEEINVLDQLSCGRAMLGLGRGMRATEYDGFAVPYPESIERFFELLDATLALLGKDPVTYEGRWFRCNGVVIAPRPVQAPHVPMVLATSSNPRSARYAAAHGMRLAQGLGPMSELHETVQEYRRSAAPGAAPSVTLMRMACVRRTWAEARAVAEQSVFDQFRAFSGDPDPTFATPNDASFRHHTGACMGGRLGPHTFDELVDTGYALIGDPATVAKRIETLASGYGAECVLGSFNLAGLPDPAVAESLERFAVDVWQRL